MKKYAQVQNGIVQSVFYSDKPKSFYKDVEHLLHVVPDEVQCNWIYKDGHFYPKAEPVPVLDAKGEVVDYVIPTVAFVKKNITWQQVALSAGAAGAAVAASYFLS